MRQGTTIDPETAQRILKNVMSLVVAVGDRPKANLLGMRPVIWSEVLAGQAMDAGIGANGDDVVPYPKRCLCHIICLDKQITVHVALPTYHSKTGEFSSLMSMLYIADYTGRLTAYAQAEVFIGTSSMMRKFETLYKRTPGLFKGEAADIAMVCIEEEIAECERLNKPSQKLAPLFQLSILEHYAFSTYAVTRPRPTTKQATNPNPKKKGFAAIEVVSLRLPEKRKDAEPGTGKKLDMRIQVSEHLRRQPTKTGIKLITIASHWRGPESAPVKPKAAKVYKVIK